MVWLLLDPLFLLFVFYCLRFPSGRFLWLQGIFLGFLKDLITGGLFGGWACSFGLIGWVLGATRDLVEREDPVIQAVWAGLLTGLNGIFYALIITLADPAIGWNRWWWGAVPLSMGVSVGCALWVFPRLHRLLKVGRLLR